MRNPSFSVATDDIFVSSPILVVVHVPLCRFCYCLIPPSLSVIRLTIECGQGLLPQLIFITELVLNQSVRNADDQQSL